MSVPFVDLEASYQSMKQEINVAISQAVLSFDYILGPKVQFFEGEMAKYLRVAHAVGVASGTDALHLALRACGVGPGDEVITTPFTFVATAEVINHCGAKPVFVDIDPKTYNIDVAKIKKKVSQKTKVIIPVHLYGQPCDMDEIMILARKHGIKVIEDCAQALGANYKGEKVGSIGDVGCLSFFPTKTLGAYGDGGMVVTHDGEIAEKVRMLRVHGARAPYDYAIDGFNSRLDEIHAAILRAKLAHLDEWISLRNEKALIYNELLRKVEGIDVPFKKDGNRHAYNYYTILVSGEKLDRDDLRHELRKNKIQAMVYYTKSLHLQEPYSHLKFKKDEFKVSEWAQDRVLSLPMYPEITREQLNEVAGVIKKFVGEKNV